jgi:hypothetical protein
VLTQVPTRAEIAGVTLVIAGVALHRERSQVAPALAPPSAEAREAPKRAQAAA